MILGYFDSVIQSFKRVSTVDPIVAHGYVV